MNWEKYPLPAGGAEVDGADPLSKVHALLDEAYASLAGQCESTRRRALADLLLERGWDGAITSHRRSAGRWWDLRRGWGATVWIQEMGDLVDIGVPTGARLETATEIMGHWDGKYVAATATVAWAVWSGSRARVNPWVWCMDGNPGTWGDSRRPVAAWSDHIRWSLPDFSHLLPKEGALHPLPLATPPGAVIVFDEFDED